MWGARVTCITLIWLNFDRIQLVSFVLCMLYLQGFPTNIFPTFFFIEMIFGKQRWSTSTRKAGKHETNTLPCTQSWIFKEGMSWHMLDVWCRQGTKISRGYFTPIWRHFYQCKLDYYSGGSKRYFTMGYGTCDLVRFPMVPLEKPNFFLTDCWHNFHLGLAKHFLASSFVCAIERLNSFPATSVESRFDFLTQDFADFCKLKNIHAYMKEISRETCSFPSSKACPVGRWSKGVVASQWMAYLENYCDRFVVNKTDDPVMLTIVLGQNIQYRKSFHFLFQLPHGFVLNGLMGPLVWWWKWCFLRPNLWWQWT